MAFTGPARSHAEKVKSDSLHVEFSFLEIELILPAALRPQALAAEPLEPQAPFGVSHAGGSGRATDGSDTRRPAPEVLGAVRTVSGGVRDRPS